MRRGLMHWSREELPEATLDARVARLQEATRAQGLAAVLAYTSFARPAPVHWLSNFTPYWNEAMLVVLPEGRPVLLASLTPRVYGWIREVAHLGDIVPAPKLGPACAQYLTTHIAPGAAVGVIDLPALPWPVAQALHDALGPQRLHDASALYQALRQPADADEIALARAACRIAASAMDTAPAGHVRTATLSAQMERVARLAGAEELLHKVAPDLERSAALQRLEGDLPLSPPFAVELSLAYKGVWVRHGRSFAASTPPAWWATAEDWFTLAVADLPALLAGRLAPPPGVQIDWMLEACTAAHPLTPVVASTGPIGAYAVPPPGSLCVLSVRASTPAGHWLATTPVVLHAGHGEALHALPF